MTSPSPNWRTRFRYPTVRFPQWSSIDPDRLVFVSNEGGTNQIWTSHLPSGERSLVTSQRVGVEDFVMSPRGDAVAWWSDDSGDGNGAWVSTSLSGDHTTPLMTGLADGWSEGLAWCGDTVAMALTDEKTYRLYVGTAGGVGHLIHESQHPFGLGREWETTPGGLSTDGALLCLRHTEYGDILHFGLRVMSTANGVQFDELADDGLTVRVASWSPVAGDQKDLRSFTSGTASSARRYGSRWQRRRRDYSLPLPGDIDVAGRYPDANALLLVHWHDGRSQLYRLDLDTGAHALVHDPKGYISGAGVRPDGTVWLREEAGERAPRIRAVDGTVALPVPGTAPVGVPWRSIRFDGWRVSRHT